MLPPGARPRAAGPPPPPGRLAGNRLLAALSRADAERLHPALEPVRLIPGEVLIEPGQWMQHVVFPESGVISLVAEFGPRQRAEVGLIGREGMLGLSALLGGPTPPFRAVVQVAGAAQRLPLGMLRGLLLHGGFGLRDLILRYAAACHTQAATTAACNTLHPLRPRAARWLLSIQDRAGPGFLLTQEILADMLGARRPTVNAVLQRMKAEGIIRTARGRIAIADPAGLEAIACPCRQRLLAAEAELSFGPQGPARARGDTMPAPDTGREPRAAAGQTPPRRHGGPAPGDGADGADGAATSPPPPRRGRDRISD